MKLTGEQQNAVVHPGHALVVACPGSGKTRTIIAKLLRSVDDVRDTPRRVACITYTNTAVQEIEERVRRYGGSGDDGYCEVATIHAFCQNNVLRYFHWKLAELTGGYSILPSDSELYAQFADEIVDKYGLNDFAKQQFEQINRTPSGLPITPPEIPQAAALEFWNLLRRHGYIDFTNLVYYSYRLLAEHPSVARGIACRFKHILVDEFQDTSAIQVEILKLIAAHNVTSFFLVGDPEQSIYSFAGAERQLMFDFRDHLAAKEFPLSGNYRSSEPVVRCAETLIPRTQPMYAAGEFAHFVDKPGYEYVDNHFVGITDFFLPMIEANGIDIGDCAILAPSWFQLRPLGKRLREYGVPVVGPGARPYKRSHLFARIAEEVCAYVENPRPLAIPAIEREIFQLVNALTGKSDFRIFTYDGRRTTFKLLHAARELREKLPGAVNWLESAAVTFSEILHQAGFVPPTCQGLMTESVKAMCLDMQKADVDLANLALADMGMFANPAGNLKLLTIHQSKGREFSAVAIVALNDGIIPFHNKHVSLTTESENESRRVLYVAITRARRLLMMFANRADWRPPCRFVGPLGLPGLK